VEHSYTKGNTESWGTNTVVEASAGFSFWGIGASVTVSHGTSHEISHEYSSTFTQTNTITETYTAPEGALWQWRFQVNDTCGHSLVNTTTFVSTPSIPVYPCCLPGYAVDPGKQHGVCSPANYTVCGPAYHG